MTEEDHSYQVSDFEPYGNLYFLKNKKKGPHEWIHNGNTYVRYMDRIYLPAKPSALSEQDVEDLASLRILKGSEIINHPLTQAVLAALYNECVGALHGRVVRLLDFGCGDGNIISSMDYAKDWAEEFAGVDICEMAVRLASVKFALFNGEVQKVTWTSKFSLPSSHFCAIVANFVMHFPVSAKQIRELYRILIPGGVFVYNDYLYKKDREHFLRTRKLLEDAGFRTVTKNASIAVHYGPGSVNRQEKIVVCSKKP